MLAFAAVLRNRPGVWIGDNRFELYANPGQRIDRALVVWDTTRGLGRIREEFWPGITLGIGVLRALGISEPLTQHLWHGILISLGGIGMVVLLRFWRPQIDLTHWVGALLYMFGPFSTAFLLPSNLYLNYAAAPWLVAAVLYGLRPSGGWRHAAFIALTIGLIGNVDYGGLMFCVIFAIVAGLVHTFTAAQTSVRQLLFFGFRTAVLAIPVNAAALFKTALAAEVFAQRLRDTETTTIISVASSWSESLRGLGSWLLYVPGQTGPTRPQAAIFFTNDAVVLATFVLPIIAMIALLIKDKSRAVLGTLLIVGAIFMVGTYPVDAEPPLGQLLAWARGNIAQLGALRNGFKAGSGLMMGMAGLVGIAASWLAEQLHRRQHQVAAFAGAAIVLLLVTMPFWRGPLYNPDWELDKVPSYVDEFATWINDQSSEHRALVVPGSTRNGFRWGWVNDDYLDAWIERPHATNTVIELSRPISADVLHELDRSLHLDTADGLTGQVARRIGADLVVIRNDHQWELWGQPPPAELDDLRDDPDLQLVATFGEPGEYTASGLDASIAAGRARELPPIEVYAVQGAPTMVGVRTAPTIVTSGTGTAWATLQRAELLQDHDIVYSGDLTVGQLAQELTAGAPLIITDTNRRREVAITSGRLETWTLTEDEQFSREIVELFDSADTQTLADFGDASRVTNPATELRFRRDTRPGLAIDGLLSTAWITGVNRLGDAPRLEFEFDNPTVLTGLQLQAATGLNGPRVVEAEIRINDATVVPATFDVSGHATVEAALFGSEPVETLHIALTQILGERRGLAGLAEVTFEGADVRDAVRTPIDVFTAATTNAELQAALETAPVGWVFHRDAEAEQSLARVFPSWNHAGLETSGTLALGADATDQTLALAARGDITVTSSGRVGEGLSGWAGHAFDDDSDTAWLARPSEGEWLEASVPTQSGAELTIVVDQSDERSLVHELAITINPETNRANGDDAREPAAILLRLKADCNADAGQDPECRERVSVPIDPDVPVHSVLVELTDVDVRGVVGRPLLPVAIHSVELDGQPLGSLIGGASAQECDLVLGELDGNAMTVRVLNEPATLLAGEAAAFQACETTDLAEGEHFFRATPGLLIDDLVIISPEIRTDSLPSPAPQSVAVQTNGAVGWTVEVPPSTAGWFTIGQSFDPRWHATLNGQDLGPAEARNTLTGWRLPGDGGTLVITFAAQSRFRMALGVSGVASILAFALLFGARRRIRLEATSNESASFAYTGSQSADQEPASDKSVGRARHVVVAALAIAVGALLAGWPGAFVALGALGMGGRDGNRLGPRSAIAAAFLLAVAAVDTALGPDVVNRSFASQRGLAHAAATLSAILFTIAVIAIIAADRPASGNRRVSRPSWSAVKAKLRRVR